MRFALMTCQAALLVGASVQAHAAATASMGARLSLEVPVVCKLAYSGDVVQSGDRYALGQLQQYCNAPGGYAVQVEYQPGTLRGTILQVGDRQLLLDGSGHAEVVRGSGPRITTMDVSATPAAAGFDSASLAFQIQPL